ncbi:uncharacterized protein B0H18DRAFT_1007387 [Fomitopsis serialis]|uniref:uncharacterized protein n=1 Tax=Fomitopsis serialis TaxID=139415 RepID=UPI002008509A|nr:uncharacterized protein B0H18DRAFT_1007387 [Neoantrodia serialis]KAH9926001.1 hypothetical protein B0H18DRAFT_1007387 [Neoantrodia serialis]
MFGPTRTQVSPSWTHFLWSSAMYVLLCRCSTSLASCVLICIRLSIVPCVSSSTL